MINIWPIEPPPPVRELLSLSMPALRDDLKRIRYPLLFSSIAGSHLYGFDSPDSDYDIRAVHICPIYEFTGLYAPQEVVTHMMGGEEVEVYGGNTVRFAEVDIVSFDIRKFFSLLLAGNGNVLEQVTSPIKLSADDSAWDDLWNIVNMTVTRRVLSHYLGFGSSCWANFGKATDKRVKELLYVFRALLTGLMLSEEGKLIAHLPTLANYYHAEWLLELIQMKQSGHEKMVVGANVGYERRFIEYHDRLVRSKERSTLPEMSDAKYDFLRSYLSGYMTEWRRAKEV